MEKNLTHYWAHERRGSTAGELIAALTVLAVVVAGIAIVAQNLLRSRNVAREVSEISRIVAKARSFHGSQPTIAGFSNMVAAQAGIVGPDKFKSGNVVARPTGTILGFGTATISGVARSGFVLQYLFTAVNRQLCDGIVSDLAATADYALWRAGPGGGAAGTVMLAIDGAAVASDATVNPGGLDVVEVNTAGAGAGAGAELTATAVAAACGPAAITGTLTLIYRK